MSAYRLRCFLNINTFFDELIAMSLSKAVNKLDDLIIMVDFNIDMTKEVCLVNDKLKKIHDTFNLIMILQ